MKQYSILRQIKNGKLILWDGPSLARKKADQVLKLRKEKYPEVNFFVYMEDGDARQT